MGVDLYGPHFVTGDSAVAALARTLNQLVENILAGATPATGSVTDAKVAADAAIAQSKIAGLVADLATKLNAAGIVAKAAATTNQDRNGLDVIDGYQTVAGDQVLLTAQTTPSENGPWIVAAGAWTRPADFATGSVHLGRAIVVSGGTLAGSVWTLNTTAPVTVGTTAQTWVNAPVRSGIYPETATVVLKANNLADVPDPAAARTNLSAVGEGELALQPMPVSGATLTVQGADPTPLESFGGYLWGRSGTNVHRSADSGATWTLYTAVPGAPQAILPCADGEVLIVLPNAVHRSTGWNGGAPTFAQVLDASGGGPNSTVERWGIDGDGTKFIITEYAGNPANYTESRYAWISTNQGVTWTQVWDSGALWGADNANSHLHAAAYSPWDDRFWLIEGHGAPKGVYYSDDNGGTWTKVVDDMLAGLAGGAYFTATATDYGLVLGSDSSRVGVFAIRRGETAVREMWRYRSPEVSTTIWGQRSFRDPATGIVYVGFRSDAGGLVPLIIAASDARTGALVWSGSPVGHAAGDKVDQLVVSPTGTLVARLSRTAGNLVLRATTEGFGVAETPSVADSGHVLGGSGADDSVAVGPGSSVGGALRSVAVGIKSLSALETVVIGHSAGGAQTSGVAVGYLATLGAAGSVAIGRQASAGFANCVVIGREATVSNTSAMALGYQAAANGSAVAIGANANASGLNAVAVGRQSTVDDSGVAIGQGCVVSGGSGVAVGRGATSTAIEGTAVGRLATCGHARSVAIGKSSTTTAVDQVAVGAHHVELTEIAADPVAPAVNAARWYTKDNGAGKTQLCVRFNTGAVQVLATEP